MKSKTNHFYVRALVKLTVQILLFYFEGCTHGRKNAFYEHSVLREAGAAQGECGGALPHQAGSVGHHSHHPSLVGELLWW